MSNKRLNNPVYVTQPSLPPLDEFSEYLNEIWRSKIVTNNGPYHKEFEKALSEFLGVKYISLFANGTLALMTALQALNIQGDVITTPYSFVATAHSLTWNNIKPIFVDINPETFNLDPDAVEKAITPNTSAILPVHVYGIPCEVDRLEEIAHKKNLKLIYDAAHSFGVKLNGNSILNYGDVSILSFHATKVFNTLEGGAIISHNEKMKLRIDQLKNFGFLNEVTVVEQGINAKMNEVQAALGLLQLKYIESNIKERKQISDKYDELLYNMKGIRTLSVQPENVEYNYSYFPILIDSIYYGKTRDELYYYLQKNNIFGRRYFYPLINEFPSFNDLPVSYMKDLSVARKISESVICLPIYPGLSLRKVESITNLIANFR